MINKVIIAKKIGEIIIYEGNILAVNHFTKSNDLVVIISRERDTPKRDYYSGREYNIAKIEFTNGSYVTIKPEENNIIYL